MTDRRSDDPARSSRRRQPRGDGHGTRGHLLAAVLLIGIAPAVREAEMTDEQVLAGAEERIERYRKADVRLTIRLSGGEPASHVPVRIEQGRHQFLFGSNVFMLGRCRVPEHNRLYEEQFARLLNYATVPFYWWSYEPEAGKPRHEETEAFLGWCRRHRIAVKGHPLMWNFVDPRWLPDDLSAIRRLQLERIEDCVGRFRDIGYWDVVNEAVKFDRPEILRNAPKLTAAVHEVGKMEFVRQAFRAARAANPDAVLLINDYITTEEYATEVIGRLTDESGRPLYDVIGIQCHQHGGTWGAAHTWAICERFSRFGVPLHFTEATILSGQQGWNLAETRPAFDWASTPEGEARQAQEVVRFYTVLFSHPAVEAITWWDFADQGAWQRAPAGLLRRDMSPKPAYGELLRLVKDRWWTRAERVTDDEGTCEFRGFGGDYVVRARIGGRVYEGTFTVRAPSRRLGREGGGPQRPENRITVRLTGTGPAEK